MNEQTAQAASAASGSVRSVPSNLQEFSKALGDPDWLARWRAEAYGLYEETPLPIRAAHLWRYTDPALFLPASDPFSPQGGAGSADAGIVGTSGARQFAGAGGGRAGDETGAHLRLAPELVRSGVICMDLRTAACEAPDRLRGVLGTVAGPEHGKFEALNAAAFRSGIFLYVPPGVVPDQPIHLVHAFSREGFSAVRLAVLVGEGASVDLIYELEGGPERGTTQAYAVAELRVGAEARVNFVTLQTLSKRVNLHLTQRAVLDRGAVCQPVIASFGGGLSKVDTGVILEGIGSESEMTGFLSGIGRQKFDHHTVHHHLGQRTRSNLDFKTVLKDKARSVYTGLIRIEPQAAYAEAYQENRNLLLSGDCRADSIPELEILNEEVQCKHGATVGPIDQDHLFYLMSRGIPEHEAVSMIVEGHFEPTLRKLPEATQENLRGVLRDRLRVA